MELTAPADAVVWVCAPTALIDAVAKAADELPMARERVQWASLLNRLPMLATCMIEASGRQSVWSGAAAGWERKRTQWRA